MKSRGPPHPRTPIGTARQSAEAPHPSTFASARASTSSFSMAFRSDSSDETGAPVGVSAAASAGTDFGLQAAKTNVNPARIELRIKSSASSDF
jgi:hypothetical protein